PSRIDVFGSRRLRDDEIESLARASRDRLIPRIVFQLARPQLAHFLRTLFDMGAGPNLAQGRGAKISYSTFNERHARQVQHLLLRFGVIAKLSDASSGNEAMGRQSWRLEITDAHSLKQLYKDPLEYRLIETTRFGDRSANWTVCVTPPLAHCWKLGRPDGSPASFDSLVAEATRTGQFALLSPRVVAARDVYWDEILSIE